MITLKNWQQKMSEDMRLRDFRPRTQEAYVLAVRQFLDKAEREPEALTDGDVRKYFLFLREEKKMVPSTINIAVHGLRFFFSHTLHRHWPVFDLLRVNRQRKLPAVLGRDEIRSLLSAIRHPASHVRASCHRRMPHERPGRTSCAVRQLRARTPPLPLVPASGVPQVRP